jgi:ribosome-binding protein aMBF1 (putative translation factor)
MLAAKAKVNRSRLSNIERGYVQPNEDELRRLDATLEQLIQTKSVLQRTANELGWPAGEVR